MANQAKPRSTEMVKMLVVGAVAAFALCLYTVGMCLEMACAVEYEKRARGKQNRRG